MQRVTHLLNYCATHPEAEIRFKRSNMVLHVKSGASYLCLPKAGSRVGGYHYLSSMPRNPGQPPAAGEPRPPMNGAINVMCNILRVVVSSAAEAELAGLFHNAKEAVALHTVLLEMGHDQPPTPLVTDNSMATGIANDTVKQKQSKAMDMRFYWLRDRGPDGQKQFVVYWQKGATNLADYFTKDHAAAHHQDMRKLYIHQSNNAETYHESYNQEIQHYYGLSTDDRNSEINHMCLFYATVAAVEMTTGSEGVLGCGTGIAIH
jgi:hypothetical protein